MTDPDPASAMQPALGLRSLLVQAGTVAGSLVLLVIVWGLLAQIASAVIATGEVAGEYGPRPVEHPVGGRVEIVEVEEGQAVRRGQLIARLAPVVVDAAATFSSDRVADLEARRHRLLVERDGGALSFGTGDTRQDQARRAEAAALTSRRQLDRDRRSQLDQDIVQSEAQIEGLKSQLEAIAAQSALIAQELEAMRRLLAQGFATVTRVNALERESHRLEAERGSLSAAISRERARIAQTQAQRFQLLSERQVSVAEDLKQTELQLSEARAQRAADSEAKRSLDIVAPVSGRIQQLAMRAGGGILSPGEAMAIVVPDRERLLIEVRIAPDKIDRLRPGQTVKVRFPAFQASTTPEFPARLLRISPTISRDEQTGLTYYAVACALDPSEHPALVRLRPGMPAEAHIATGSQPALLYFLKPLLDQISRTFREP